MKTYSLYFSTHPSLPAIRVSFGRTLKISEKLFLKNCDYYSIKDMNGEMIYEQEIVQYAGYRRLRK